MNPSDAPPAHPPSGAPAPVAMPADLPVAVPAPPHRRLGALAALLALLLLLALAWQFTPARQWLQPATLLAQARALGWGWQLVVFVLAGCAAVPLSLLTLLGVLVLGPWAGALTALLGGALIGGLCFGTGAWLGRRALAQWAGPRLQAVNALVARRGFWAVLLVRLVPAAPFAVVTLLLGATPIRWLPFLLGNTLGMLPMVLATAWLAPQILAQLQAPSGAGLGLLAAVLLLLAAGSWALRRWAQRQ